MWGMIFARQGKPFTFSIWFTVCLGVLCAGYFPAVAATTAATATSGSALVVQYDNTARQIGISIVSTSPAIARLMQTAFSIHGAFNTSVPASSVEYVLRFTEAGPGRVDVSVESKTSGGSSFQAEGVGKDSTEAAYSAGDAVVEKLTQRPGFFAGKLAFISKRTKYAEIWVSDLLGQAPLQITTDRSTSANPRWSPDGTKLLYYGYYASGFPDIILVNFASGKRSTFAAYEGTNMGGVFSPDGKSVAMILSSKEGGTELYVSDATGKNVHRLTHSVSSKSSPTWSPDGKQIILTCDPRGSPLLYKIAATGGSLDLVKDNSYAYSAEPAWNPRDSDVIAFMQQMSNGTEQVLTYNFKTGKIDTLADGYEPCWTNDGRHIIYTNRVKGQEQLYIVDSITKKMSSLTTKGASDPAFVYAK